MTHPHRYSRTRLRQRPAGDWTPHPGRHDDAAEAEALLRGEPLPPNEAEEAGAEEPGPRCETDGA
jgi:hypothetical protein